MVKFPASSNVPWPPNPNTEPFGPPPGVFCQSRFWSGSVSDEQWTRKIDAARTKIAQTRVMWAPDRRVRRAQTTLRSAFASISAAAAATATRRRSGNRHERLESRIRGVGDRTDGGVAQHRHQLVPAGSERRGLVELGAG